MFIFIQKKIICGLNHLNPVGLKPLKLIKLYRNASN